MNKDDLYIEALKVKELKELIRTILKNELKEVVKEICINGQNLDPVPALQSLLINKPEKQGEFNSPYMGPYFSVEEKE